MKHALYFIWLVAFLLALTGCSTMQPLQSTPRVGSLKLAEPAKVRYGLANVFLPAGEYRARYEDKKGYYYEAPAKLVGNNTGAWLWEGGLFVPKGGAVPNRYYIISRNNSVELHKLSQALPLEAVP